MATAPLPSPFYEHCRIRLLPFNDGEVNEPEQLGTLIGDDIDNGTICVQIDEIYRDDDDDGLREVMMDQVEFVS